MKVTRFRRSHLPEGCRKTTTDNPRCSGLPTLRSPASCWATRGISTAEQNPDHQTDALTRAGVAPGDIYLDKVSGAKASRPQLDALLRTLREGDVLVVTRLGRSVLHLVQLGAQLRERGIGLRVLEQGIDTSTTEIRAMFGMLSVLAEFQRELISANTRDGLAAARVRGRRGDRPPALSPTLAAHARGLYDAGQHTVAEIAGLLGVARSTVYGHLRTTPTATGADADDRTRADVDAFAAEVPPYTIEAVLGRSDLELGLDALAGRPPDPPTAGRPGSRPPWREGQHSPGGRRGGSP